MTKKIFLSLLSIFIVLSLSSCSALNSMRIAVPKTPKAKLAYAESIIVAINNEAKILFDNKQITFDELKKVNTVTTVIGSNLLVAKHNLESNTNSTTVETILNYAITTLTSLQNELNRRR